MKIAIRKMRARSGCAKFVISMAMCSPLALLMGCGAPAGQFNVGEGNLKQLAREARQRGQTEVDYDLRIEPIDPIGLNENAPGTSFVVAVPSRAALDVNSNFIVTWEHFQIVSWLKRTAGSEWCGSGGPERKVSDESLLAALPKGTAMIDGIMLRNITAADINFEEGQKYLLIGERCPGNTISLVFRGNSALRVSDQGVISPAPFNDQTSGFIREILQLGTLEALQNRLNVIDQP